MKKKLLALALALALSLSACGGKDAPSQDAGSPEVGAPEAGESRPAGEGESAPPDETSPDEPGAPAESEPQADADLAAFYASLTESAEWPALMNLTEDETMTELLDSYYPGLSELSAKQCGVYVAAISAAVGELALVEVENAEDVEKVKDIFQARIDYQVGDDNAPGGAWYPATIEGWKTKSHIVSHDNYVMLAVGDNAGAAVDAFEALFA